MGSNIVNNTLFLLLIMAVFMGLVIVFTVTNAMVSETQEAINSTGININTTAMPYATEEKYEDYKGFLIVNFTFLVYFLVIMTLYSSFVNSTDFKGYILYAIAGTLATAVLSQMATIMWNEFSGFTDILDFSDFGVNELWFITNLTTLFAINLLAAFTSFVFVKRGSNA